MTPCCDLKPTLLLHSCCGPCSTSVIERLAPQFRLAVYFCNSNITEEAEYEKRMESQKAFLSRWGDSDSQTHPIDFICAPYEPGAFLALMRGFEHCAEGGARCRLCIGDRLEKTAYFAKENGYDAFATTLSVSRHKDSLMIRELGKALAVRYGIFFEDRDFKKGGGEQRSLELSKAYGLYRQNYCGCQFSKPGGV